MIHRNRAGEQRGGSRTGVGSVDRNITRARLGQTDGADRAVEIGPEIGGRRIHDGLTRTARTEDPVIGMGPIGKGAENHTGRIAPGGRTDGDIESTGNRDVADAEGLHRHRSRQSLSRSDVYFLEIGRGERTPGGRSRHIIGDRHQPRTAGRNESRGRGGEMIDDPRGDHAVGGRDRRPIQVGDDELGVGAEVGRQPRQGHRTSVLADQIRGGDDGVVNRGGTLLDRDEVTALDVDGAEGLGNKRGPGDRARHAQITAAQIEHGGGGQAEVAARHRKAVTAKHESLRLTGGDREGGVENVDGGVVELRGGSGVITRDCELARDIQEASCRNDVLQGGVRNLELAVTIDRGGTGVILEGVEIDDTRGIATEQADAGQRVTDDQGGRTGEDVGGADGQHAGATAGAEAVDASIGGKRGGRVIDGRAASRAEEPGAITRGAGAGLGHVDRVGCPTRTHQLQGRTIGTRADVLQGGEVEVGVQEQAPHVRHRHGGGTGRGVLVREGDISERGQDVEAARTGEVRGTADEIGRTWSVNDRSGTGGGGVAETTPAVEDIDATREIVAGIGDRTSARADQGQGAGAGELAADREVRITFRLTDQESRGEALQRDRAVEPDVVAILIAGGGQSGRDALQVRVVEIQRRVRDADRTTEGTLDAAALVDGRTAVDRRRTGDDDVVREREGGARDEAERGARIERDGPGAERAGEGADGEHAGVDDDFAGQAGVGVGEDEITPALLAETVGPGQRRSDDGDVVVGGAEPAGVRDDRSLVGAERERESAADVIVRGIEDESADRDGIRPGDSAAGAAEIGDVRIGESVGDRRIQTRNETAITGVDPVGGSQIPGSRSADAGVDPVGVPEDVGGAGLRW